jgi:very-short-patch-repair endonuclease
MSDERTLVERIPITGVARTQFDLASMLPRHRLERAMNQADVLGLTDRVSLPELLDRHPRRPGNAALRAVLIDAGRARGVTGNKFEELFAAFIEQHGLPRPRFNADVAIGERFIEVDALWEEPRLMVELDGRQTHGTSPAFEVDRARDRLVLVEGWRVARVTWKQLRDEPDALAADLRRLTSTL